MRPRAQRRRQAKRSNSGRHLALRARTAAIASGTARPADRPHRRSRRRTAVRGRPLGARSKRGKAKTNGLAGWGPAARIWSWVLASVLAWVFFEAHPCGRKSADKASGRVLTTRRLPVLGRSGRSMVDHRSARCRFSDGGAVCVDCVDCVDCVNCNSTSNDKAHSPARRSRLATKLRSHGPQTSATRG
jgi:hypothetical protein